MGTIDRLRWRAAAALAPKMPPHISADSKESGLAYRELLNTLGHRVMKCRSGDAEMSAVVHSMIGGHNPFDAKVTVQSMKARVIVTNIIRTIDPDARMTCILGRRSVSVFMVDPAVFDRLLPHRTEAPDITPPENHVSPRKRTLLCHYCETEMGITLDHVVPRAIGGADFWWNIVPACESCNMKMSHQPPECPCFFCRRAVSMFIDGYRVG